MQPFMVCAETCGGTFWQRMESLEEANKYIQDKTHEFGGEFGEKGIQSITFHFVKADFNAYMKKYFDWDNAWNDWTRNNNINEREGV